MNIVFCDIDGTFQEMGEEIPDINYKAIEALQNQGDHFVFVTGRGYEQIQEVIAPLKKECDVIFSNGAGHKLVGQELKYTHVLSLASCRRIITVLEKEDAFYHLHTSQGVFLRPSETYAYQFGELRKKLASLGEAGTKIMDFKEQYFAEECQPVNNPIAYLAEHPEINVLKIEMMDADNVKQARIYEQLKNDDLYIFSSFIQCMEFVNPLSSKGTAIEEFLKAYPKAKSFGIGDAENDLAMLATVDYPVAVANASNTIKEQCSFITVSAKEGGVGRFIFDQVIQ